MKFSRPSRQESNAFIFANNIARNNRKLPLAFFKGAAVYRMINDHVIFTSADPVVAPDQPLIL